MTKHKKFFAVIISAIMAAACLPAFGAAAYASGTTEPSVCLEADSITLERGETGTVSISLKDFENSASVNNLTFYAVVDPDIAEISSVKMMSSDGTYSVYDETSSYINSEITSAHLTIDKSGVYTKDDIGKTPFEAGKIKFAFYSSATDGSYLYAFDSDVAVAEITFKGLSSGTTSVSLTVVDCNSTPGTAAAVSVSCTPVNGSVTVVYTLVDAVQAMQYAAKYAEDPSSLTDEEFAAADVYSDNVIDEKDAACILKKLIFQQS